MPPLCQDRHVLRPPQQPVLKLRLVWWAIVGAGVTVLWLPSMLGAQSRAPALAVAEYQMAGPPQHVGIVRWAGRDTVMVLSVPLPAMQGPEPRLPTRRLSLVRYRGDVPTVIAEWEVPESLRWTEPVPLGNGDSAWLALMGQEWYLGRPHDSEIDWQFLCACPSAFALGYEALHQQTPLAADLDGDGRVEVLLPDWNGLTIHALDTQRPAMTPIWRDAWEPDEQFSESDGRLTVQLRFPRYLLMDVNADGIQDLALLAHDTLWVIPHPSPLPQAKAELERASGGPFHVLDTSTLMRLQQAGLPEPLLVGLRELGNRSFDSTQAAEARLREVFPESEPHLAEILHTSEQPYPVYFSRAAPRVRPPIPTGDDGPLKESLDVLAVRDMDGDQLPDLLEITITEKGDPFNQRNQISWYRGRQEAGRPGGLRFGEPQRVYFTEGLAFAYLVDPELDGPPAFLLATMEVGLMDLVRAIVARSVTFDAFLYQWEAGELPAEASVTGDVTFDVDFSEKGSRPYLVLADLDGDGRREMLFNVEPNLLAAYSTDPRQGALAADEIARIEVPLPHKPEGVLRAALSESDQEIIVLKYEGGRYPVGDRRTLRFVRWLGPLPAADGTKGAADSVSAAPQESGDSARSAR